MINKTNIGLYVYIDGINDVPFFGSGEYENFILLNGETFIVGGQTYNVRTLNEHIVIHNFTYQATRMGAAPTISCTLMHQECLDNFFKNNIYALFNNEKYFLKQIPTSSYSSEDIMYKHELEFVSERIALENVYFYDVVDAEFDDDKPVSNKSEFSFSGDIYQFAERLNQSLQYAGLEYTVVVDDGIESDDKLVTVENNFFSAVLQDIYNVYDLPYYFVGKVIHIGHSANAIDEVFSYGAENALLSVTKTNAGNRVINRVTGLGSEDNIPYYYPNLSPKGDIKAEAGENNTGITDDDITIIDYEKYAENVELDGVITAHLGAYRIENYQVDYGQGKEPYNVGDIFDAYVNTQIDTNAGLSYDRVVELYANVVVLTEHTNLYIRPTLRYTNLAMGEFTDVKECYIICNGVKHFLQEYGDGFAIYNLPIGTHQLYFKYLIPKTTATAVYNCYFSPSHDTIYGYYHKGELLKTEVIENETYIKAYGLKITTDPVEGDTITQKLVRYINPQKNLMPPIYRQTDGAERFYNALNNTYQNPEEDEGIYYEFENPFVEGRPKEQIVQFDEVKPTIKEVKNSEGLRIDMFSEFAYDRNDNDDLYTDENGQTNYTHPYFFGKLRKLDFNLFDSAIDEGEMTIAMTSGNCGACEFIVGVDSETKQNTVQVDENGNLIYDSNGNVLCGRQDLQNQVDAQPQQQDTINNEVWIALEKDNKTFGVLIPNVEEDYKPKACTKNDDGSYNNDGDTFVILHINLPQLYIEKAEEDLYDQIIRFMYDNNFEKFNFSIKFSRIYLAEHPEILALLDENARIKILYNGQEHLLYVSSFTYKVTDSEILPEITVELKDNLAVSQNAIQRAVNKAVVDVYKTIGNIDVVAQANEHFLRSDQPDVAYQQITFDKIAILNNGATVKNGGIKSDDFYSDIRGLAISKDKDGNWHIETDYLKARKKFSAKEVEIQKVYHIGGAQIKSSANMICSRVEDAGDAYRCYMETTDDSGNTIYNQFVVGDQAYVQTFNLITNENGDTTNHFYWRLVTGVGDNFILLSKTDCAEDSTIPMVGDNIVQLGNRSISSRQIAVIDSGAGDDAPYYRQFVGINSFELPQPETQLKPNDNILTGKLVIQSGSQGLTNLDEWAEKQTEIDDAKDAADKAQIKAQEAKDAAAAVDAATTNLSQTVTDFKTNIEQSIETINKQLDGVVENYFNSYTPTTDNLPASEWIANGTEANHIGDTFTNTEAEGDNAGKSWRWLQQSDGSYNWHLIADTDAIKALQKASEAQTTADGKSSTYLEKPVSYSKGDLWIVGSDYIPNNCKIGDILTATTDSALFIEAHWSKFVRYTDDTTANKAYDLATNAQHSADSANNNAQSAIAKAENAQKTADEAKSSLEEWASDNVISPVEKQALKNEIAQIDADYKDIENDARKYIFEFQTFLLADGNTYLTSDGLVFNIRLSNIYWQDYSIAYKSYRSELLSKVNSQGNVEVGNLAEKQNIYYSTRTEILNSISLAAKASSEAATDYAKQASEVANKADQKAENAGIIANEAKSRLDSWASDDNFSPSELQSLTNEYKYIVSDFNEIKDQINRYSLTGDVIVNYYNSYQSYEDSLIRVIDAITDAKDSVKIPDEFSTHQSDYYNNRSLVLNIIAAATKKIADDAQLSVDTLPYVGANIVLSTANAITLSNAGGGSGYDWINASAYRLIKPLKKGITYTVQCQSTGDWSDEHNPNQMSDRVTLWLTDHANFSRIISDVNTDTGTTFTWDLDYDTTYYVRLNSYGKQQTFSKLKIEEGKRATDWNIAAEDNKSFYDNNKDTPPTNAKLGDTWIPQDAPHITYTYTYNGWVISGDSTGTVINQGLVTTGTIQLGDPNYTAKAGITGAGTTEQSVRIWAGSGETDKDNAPFRVQQDGTMYANKGVFSGLVRKNPTHINTTNYTEYLTQISSNAQGGYNYMLDLTKTGSFVVFDDWFDDVNYVHLYLPEIEPSGSLHPLDNESDKDALRGLIGETIIIKNKASQFLNVCTSYLCTVVEEGSIKYYTLKAEAYNSASGDIINAERLYWDSIGMNMSNGY